MAAPTSSVHQVNKALANPEPSTHGAERSPAVKVPEKTKAPETGAFFVLYAA